MICTTVKKNVECALMTTNGCSYNGGVCHDYICNVNARQDTVFIC